MTERFFLSILLYFIVYGCVNQRMSFPSSDGVRTYGYHIEKNEVVFEFDIRDYQLASRDSWGGQLEFDDIDIQRIVVSGEFNNWSKDGWKMYQVNEHTYQLRKKLKDFDKKVAWQYKFLVNSKYWIEPPTDAKNKIRIKSLRSIYQNFVLNTGEPSLEGNTTFRLQGFPFARQVYLAGTFNNWQPEQILMAKEGDAWLCRIDLPPGHHLYKFIVDGKWIDDPENPHKQRNQHGTFNSILWKGENGKTHVGHRQVAFVLQGDEFLGAKRVYLAGTFNNWKEEELLCELKGDSWIYSLTLPPGKYEYKFIVDGIWMIDPYNPHTKKNNMGTENSVLVVK